MCLYHYYRQSDKRGHYTILPEHTAALQTLQISKIKSIKCIPTTLGHIVVENISHKSLGAIRLRYPSGGYHELFQFSRSQFERPYLPFIAKMIVIINIYAYRFNYIYIYIYRHRINSLNPPFAMTLVNSSPIIIL